MRYIPIRVALRRDRDAAANTFDDLVASGLWIEQEVGSGWVAFDLLGPNEARLGSIEIETRSNANFWVVGESWAHTGWGPLLYDIAIEYATLHGAGLASDRYVVSPQAYWVWDFYRDERPDVTVHRIEDPEHFFDPKKTTYSDEDRYDLDFYVSKPLDLLPRLDEAGLLFTDDAAVA